MATTKRENSVHVRLSDEADAALELMSEAQGIDKAKLLAQVCEEGLLGRCHALKVAAERFVRLGTMGRGRE